MKKFLILLIPVFLSFVVFSCSSSDIELDEDVEVGAEIDGVDDEEEGEDLSIESEDGLASESDSEFSDSLTDTDESNESDIFSDEDESDNLSADTSEENSSEEASDSFESTPESTEEEAGDDGLASSGEEEEGTASADLDYEDSASEDDSKDYEAEKPVKKWVSVKKITNTPFVKAGVLVNAVYLARPGETVKSISEKIYGQDKSEELYSINTTLRRRGVKTGDKVYYNSPNRLTDESQLLTYYEDLGMAPQIYTANQGDNIRVVSANLLGDEQSWKEIWATNSDVESKGQLAEGVQLRYWPAEEVASVTVSEENSVSPPVEEGFNPDAEPDPSVPEEVAGTGEPAISPAKEKSVDLASPEPPASMGMGNLEPPPPPPSPSKLTGSKASIAGKTAMGGRNMSSKDPNQTMILGVGALFLLASVALFVVIRKKRRRQSLDFNTHTQIE